MIRLVNSLQKMPDADTQEAVKSKDAFKALELRENGHENSHALQLLSNINPHLKETSVKPTKTANGESTLLCELKCFQNSRIQNNKLFPLYFSDGLQPRWRHCAIFNIVRLLSSFDATRNVSLAFVNKCFKSLGDWTQIQSWIDTITIHLSHRASQLTVDIWSQHF